MLQAAIAPICTFLGCRILPILSFNSRTSRTTQRALYLHSQAISAEPVVAKICSLGAQVVSMLMCSMGQKGEGSHRPSGMTEVNRPSRAVSSAGGMGLTSEAGAMGGRSPNAGIRCRYTVAFSRSARSRAAPRCSFSSLKASLSSLETPLSSFLAPSRMR